MASSVRVFRMLSTSSSVKKSLLDEDLAQLRARRSLYLARDFQLDLVDFSVMEQYLAEILARIVRLRADDHSVFEVNLFGDLALIELQRARLARCCQKLQQVSQAHAFQSALNCHGRISPGMF